MHKYLISPSLFSIYFFNRYGVRYGEVSIRAISESIYIFQKKKNSSKSLLCKVVREKLLFILRPDDLNCLSHYRRHIYRKVLDRDSKI